MSKITVYLENPDEEITIESNPPKTFLKTGSNRKHSFVWVYEVKITGKRNFWTSKVKKEITYHRKDVFPRSRVLRTKTEGRLSE